MNVGMFTVRFAGHAAAGASARLMSLGLIATGADKDVEMKSKYQHQGSEESEGGGIQQAKYILTFYGAIYQCSRSRASSWVLHGGGNR